MSHQLSATRSEDVRCLVLSRNLMPRVFGPRHFRRDTKTNTRCDGRRRQRRRLGGRRPWLDGTADGTGVFDMNVKMHVLVHCARSEATAAETCPHWCWELWARWLRKHRWA